MSPKLRFWKKLRKHVKASAQSAEAEEGSALTEVYCGKNPVVEYEVFSYDPALLSFHCPITNADIWLTALLQCTV